MSGAGLAGVDLSFRYAPQGPWAVRDVSAAVEPGVVLAVLGPNGSGKSSLLRLLSGALEPEVGRVSLGDVPLSRIPDRDRARRIGVVPQSEPSPFPISVRDLVAMGRYPHLGTWREPARRDHEAMERAMHRCSVEHFADRDVGTLSGGEAQRVRVARALAQEPEILLLDEPAAGLDLRHQMELHTLLRSLAGEGMGILLITHDLNLASRFAHRLLLLNEGHATAKGTPGDVVRDTLLEGVYQWPVRVVEHPGPGPDVRAPQAIPLARRVVE
ncbi:MAG: ABC transporter ATP-binding protein [Gemmatimonadales bacterium]|nr:MAG: ABC transporter ATP-binding protein [Gemmatimonadales bacterium]